MLQVKQVKLNVLRGCNATSRVRLTYLGFRKTVANRCLPFQSSKGKINLQLIYLKVKNDM